MSLAQSVRYSAARHSQLVRDIAAFDYVPSALSQQSSYLTDLRERLKVSEGVLKDLQKKTKKERKEHVDLKDSTMRKFGHVIIGRGDKFKERITKEEREFMEAQEHEMQEKSVYEKLQQDLNEAEQTHHELNSASERRSQLQKELENLYESVFQGPTPDIPEEDHLETAVRSADADYVAAQNSLNQEGQALGSLSDALATLENCLRQLRQAESASGMDMWGVGGHGADMMERSAMNTAQGLASQVDMLINQARRFAPHIKQFPQLQVAKASMTDVYFDNIFSDMKAHEKIQENIIQCRRFVAELQAEVRRIEVRVASLGDSMQQKQASLERTRGELHAVRQAAFESIASASDGAHNTTGAGKYTPPQGPPPTSYTEASPPAMPTGPEATHTRSLSGPDASNIRLLAEPHRSTFQPPAGPPPSGSSELRAEHSATGAFQPPVGPTFSDSNQQPSFPAPSFPLASPHLADIQSPEAPQAPSSTQGDTQTGVTRKWSTLNPFAARLASRAESARSGALIEEESAPSMPTPAHEQKQALSPITTKKESK